MAPILGIYASQISGHLWAPSGAYDSIATINVGSGGSSSVTFSSIPSGYTHLQIRMLARTNRADNLDYVNMQFNGDTGSNYAWHLLVGTGSAVSAGAGTSETSIRHIYPPAANIASNIFGSFITDVLDYSNTNKNKTARYLGAFDANGLGYAVLGSGLWMSTSAVTSITLTPISGNSFTQYSQFALFGIKGN